MPIPGHALGGSQTVPRTRSDNAPASRRLHRNRFSIIHIQTAVPGPHAFFCFIRNQGRESNHGGQCAYWFYSQSPWQSGLQLCSLNAPVIAQSFEFLPSRRKSLLACTCSGCSRSDRSDGSWASSVPQRKVWFTSFPARRKRSTSFSGFGLQSLSRSVSPGSPIFWFFRSRQPGCFSGNSWLVGRLFQPQRHN